MTIDDERTLALAGIYQASAITQDLARRGTCNDAVLTASLSSLFTFDAPDTLAVFGKVENLETGLRAVVNRMATQAEITDFELSRYVSTLTQLASRLESDGDMAGRIYEGIKQLPHWHRPDDDGDNQTASQNLCQELADVYVGTVSQMSPQVVVHGEHGHLSNSEVVARVRAVLLAGVRSAWLWRQLGGRKWQLIFQKNRYIASASALMAVNGIRSSL